MLSRAVKREELHTRCLEVRGYRRDDGLYDIEGHLTDSKPFAYDMREKVLAPGEPVHDMWVRLTVDDDFVVRRAEAWTAKGPYSICQEVNPGFASLAGLKIAPGWNRKVHERIGGARGCTHLVEMLGQLATTAFQTLWAAQASKAGRSPSRPSPELINTCHTYRSDSPVVGRELPERYTGPPAALAAIRAKTHADGA